MNNKIPNNEVSIMRRLQQIVPDGQVWSDDGNVGVNVSPEREN